MTITALPTPPSRSDPANFAVRGDAFLGALPLFQAEANDLANTVNQQYNTVVIASEAAGGIAVAVNTASAAAAEATVAKDQAVLAWNSAMSPAETLPIISKSIHVGSIVKGIIYNTSKDSDEGEWRERCQDKSWYTEALGGDRWIGQQATIAAAWTAAGSTAGAVFQASATAGPLTVGKYYSANSATTATEVFRGVTREFPAVAGVVVETARVVIYDLTQLGNPMWMVFMGNLGYLLGGVTCTSVAAGNAKILVGGTPSSGSNGLTVIDLISETTEWRRSSSSTQVLNRVSARNAAAFFGAALTNIVNSTVNDVAITVLPDAPIDAATGLPVPTIAVATAGGVSVIKQDGTVVNSAITGSFTVVNFDKDTLVTNNTSDNGYYTYKSVSSLSAGFSVSETQTSARVHGATPCTTAAAGLALRGYSVTGGGLVSVKRNPAAPTSLMVNRITKSYSSGWLPGDIRGAYLSDTVAETITGSGELVTNGAFDTYTSGWAAGNGATLSAAGALLTVTNDGTGTNIGQARQTLTTVIGCTYAVGADFIKGTATQGALIVGTSAGGSELVGYGATNKTASGRIDVSFVAATTTTHIAVANNSVAAGVTSQFDNISVKLAEPDRSVKNKGLVVNGTLTKSAVASGAGLVAYSGFSLSNYLEQPYSANLDFGTGDFCVMGWVNLTILPLNANIISRGTAGSNQFSIYFDASSQIAGSCSATGAGFTSSKAVTTGLHFIGLTRSSGILNVILDGAIVYSVANTENITNTSGVLRIGVNPAAAFALTNGSLALWRISATAPSADQIAHIYRTELPLFQPGAQCTIAGTSTAVTALAYDDSTDLLHVGTSWGRTGFKDLLRVDSEATTTGSITSLSATKGSILTSGTSGKYYQPAVLLREELNRKDTATQALDKVPVFFDFDAVTSQVLFTLPKGYTTKAVYSAGTLKRVGSTKDYTTSTDGFSESVTFAVAPGNTVWVSVMAVRSN